MRPYILAALLPEASRLVAVKSLASYLPDSNAFLLAWIVHLLHLVLEQQEKNMMTKQNLLVIFCTTLDVSTVSYVK